METLEPETSLQEPLRFPLGLGGSLLLHLVLIAVIAPPILHFTEKYRSINRLEVSLSTQTDIDTPDRAQYLSTESHTGQKHAKGLKTPQNQYQMPPEKSKSYQKSAKVAAVRPSELLHTRGKSHLSIPETTLTTKSDKKSILGVKKSKYTSKKTTFNDIKTKISREKTTRSVSPATIEAAEAQYLNQWRSKVEQVGDRHYPTAAIKQGISGKLQMLVMLNANGSIQSVKIVQPSGSKILDKAALEIIHQAEPFEPLPDVIANNRQDFGILRTWIFESH